jgi:ABC-type phosphate/phosphonate transport system ATPase subunit
MRQNPFKMLVGREREQAILQKTLRSDESEMVVVIGRRRVGKTYLVRAVYADKIRFETSGVQDAPLKEQLNNSTQTCFRRYSPFRGAKDVAGCVFFTHHLLGTIAFGASKRSVF